jgi:hypothetical protein
MQSFWVLAVCFAATMLLIGAGALLGFNPGLFVRVLRRIAVGDCYIKSQEFEKKLVSLEGRIGGFFFVCCGLFFLYAWLRAIHPLR